MIIEDDKESADEYLEDAETYLSSFEIFHQLPPREITEIVETIKKQNVTAVVIDERLRQHSDASYLGIDVLNYLKNAIPGLPVVILTEYEQDSVLRKVSREQLFRKYDLLKDSGKEYHFGILKDLIGKYRKKQGKVKSSKKNITGANKSSIKNIARLHFLIDETIEKIVWFQNRKRKEVQLIEVSRTAFPTKSVEAFPISATKEIPVKLLVADITPQEWTDIQKGKIKLPPEWDLTKIEIFEREETLIEE